MLRSSSISLATLAALFGASAAGLPVAIFQDEKSTGTNGGTFTASAWQTRVINATSVNRITGMSLASNQITFPRGVFIVLARAPAATVIQHAARLWNTTASAALGQGSTAYATNTTTVQSDSWVFAGFTLAASAVVELQHFCSSTQATTGFGINAGMSPEVYSQIFVFKVG